MPEKKESKLASMIRNSEHKLVCKGARWQCENCHFRVGTTGLKNFLVKFPTCKNPLESLGENTWDLDEARMDEPLRVRALRTLTLVGRTSHYTHDLLFYTGIYVCMRCGLAAHREVSNDLVRECLGKPTTYYRKYNRDKIRKTPPRPPMHMKEFPQAEANSFPYNYHIGILDGRTRKRMGVMEAQETLDRLGQLETDSNQQKEASDSD